MSSQVCNTCNEEFIKCKCGQKKPEGVYGEWCRDPNMCVDLGYCPRDPNCAE